MAIDSIENNELAALASSRLGMGQFIDEPYRSYTGDQEFYNLFGSRQKKKSAIREAVRAKYVNLPTDCERIQQSIDLISTDAQTLLKQKSNLNQREALDETNIILGEYKKRQIEQNCEVLLSQKKSEIQQRDLLAQLGGIGDVSVQKAQQELAGLKTEGVSGTGIKTQNILIYGGIGIAVLIGLVLIVRK